MSTKSSQDKQDTEQLLRQICTEMERRLRSGESCSAEEYLTANPWLASDADALLELIYFEFVLREDLGLNPVAEDWYRRFPEQQQSLEKIFQIHRSARHDGQENSPDGLPAPKAPSQTGDMPPAGLENQPAEDYEILDELGRGGMGVVYRARQVSLNRTVALKMILAGAHASPDQRNRFHREAQAVARLHHPNIVQVYEAGEQDGRSFLSMELVDGPSLEELLRQWHHQGRLGLTPQDSAQLLETLARAVHYAHQQGVIHRDLKPANILLENDEGGIRNDERGMMNDEQKNQSIETRKDEQQKQFIVHHSSFLIPKITDFGLAKILDGSTTTTQTGNLLGTPAYMAPEQAAGQTNSVGPQTDVYALGVILYELLTGQPPFRAPSILETLELVRTAEPPSLSQLQPHLPRDLRTICMKCLAKESGKRYASAEALAEDLRRFLKGEPILARPATMLDRTVKWVKRRPAVASLLAGIFLITVISFAVVVWQWQVAFQEGEKARAESASRLIALAHQAWLAGDNQRTRKLLVECPLVYRNAEWEFLHKVSHAEIGGFPGPGGGVAQLDFSPDGAYLARRTVNYGAIHVYDLQTKRTSSLTGITGTIRQMAFQPDTQKVIALSDPKFGLIKVNPEPQQLAIWDFPGTKLTALREDASLRFPVLNSTGSLLAYYASKSKIIIEEIATNKTIQILEGPETNFHQMIFTPDGKHLLSFPKVKSGGAFLLWDLATGKLVHQVSRQSYLEPSRDGQYLAFGSWGLGQVKTSATVLHLASGKETPIAFGPARFATMKFCPQAHYLALVGNSFDAAQPNPVTIWNLLKSSQAVAFVEPGRTGICAFSADSRWFALVSEDRVIKLWDLTEGKQTITLRGHKDMITDLVFSPKESLLASTSRDGETRLWNLSPWQDKAGH